MSDILEQVIAFYETTESHENVYPRAVIANAIGEAAGLGDEAAITRFHEALTNYYLRFPFGQDEEILRKAANRELAVFAYIADYKFERSEWIPKEK